MLQTGVVTKTPPSWTDVSSNEFLALSERLNSS